MENVPPGTLARVGIQRADMETGSSGIVKPDGTFHLWRVMPGQYEIEAALQSRTPLRSPSVEFEISGANVENLLLRPMPPIDVAGRVEFTDDAAKPTGDASPTLILTHAGFRMLEHDAAIGPDGSFDFTAVPPGLYRIWLVGKQGYVVSMQMGGQTIQGSLLDLSAGATPPLTVRISPETGTISGVVTDAQGPVPGAHVTLIFDGEGGGVFPRAVTAGPDGAYTFVKVAPARYKLIALGRDDAPISINDYVDLMDSIEVHPNDKLTHDLKRVDLQ